MKNFIKGIEAMAARRMKICRECPDWDAKFRRCKACGCFLQAKVRVPQSRCPRGKWGREDR